MVGSRVRIGGSFLIVSLIALLALFHLRGAIGQGDPYAVAAPNGPLSVQGASELAATPSGCAVQSTDGSWSREPSASPEPPSRGGDGQHGPVEPKALRPASPFVPDELLVRFKDGAIVGGDVSAVVAQFGHTCA